MAGKVRNYFPGGNTSKGFYSYYEYIIDHKSAEYIFCIKGGPGTGKSTFMKSIAEHFLKSGEDVDCFWCSADPDSLDAVLLRQRRIAFMDGTSPHIIDPKIPGAIDTILHLGDFWDTSKLKSCKDQIIKSDDYIKKWYNSAYKNLKAAAVLRRLIDEIYADALYEGELYREIEKIFSIENNETIAQGVCRKYFASAITHMGILYHMGSLVKEYKKLYVFYVPSCFNNKLVMRKMAEEFLLKGYSVEQYYCPMDPEDKIDHILIPELEVGFMTLNDYHNLESDESNTEIINIDIREFLDWNNLEKYVHVIEQCEQEIDRMVECSIDYLRNAKQEHDILEGYYIPCMDFEKIKDITDEWICKIEHNEL